MLPRQTGEPRARRDTWAWTHEPPPHAYALHAHAWPTVDDLLAISAGGRADAIAQVTRGEVTYYGLGDEQRD
jgi:hypothetical protein